MQFLPSGIRVYTAIWMHYMDATKMYAEKAWRQLHKKVATNIKMHAEKAWRQLHKKVATNIKVLEAVPHKAVDVWPPTTHHENYPKWCTPVDSSHARAKAGLPARTYIKQLCADTRCSPEDLPEAVGDREGWQ